jgi:hypothetical protein
MFPSSKVIEMLSLSLSLSSKEDEGEEEAVEMVELREGVRVWDRRPPVSVSIL